MHSYLFPQRNFYMYKRNGQIYRYDFFSLDIFPHGQFQVLFIIRGSPSNRRGRSRPLPYPITYIARNMHIVTTD